jgi:hypothetical protein
LKTVDVVNEAEMSRLRRLRANSLAARDRERLRESYGEGLAATLANSLSLALSLEDFHVGDDGVLPIDWPTDIRDASGLVAAYVGRDKAVEILKCVRASLGALSGKVGFHDKDYIGYASVAGLDPLRMIDAAESAGDSVLIFTRTPLPRGVVMVDCYPAEPSAPFSVLIQGEDLVERLRNCFDEAGLKE